MKRSSPGLCLLVLCLGWYTSIGQTWTPTDDQNIPVTGIRDIIPGDYTSYAVNDAEIKSILWTSPQESENNFHNSTTLLVVPLANGNADIFRIVRYSMMEAGLASRYPDIRTFRGTSISDPYRTIRADWTINGFRAVIRDLDGMTYIDPFQRNDTRHYIVYHKTDYPSTSEWQCEVDVQADIIHSPSQRVGDCVFRSYRLAQATTAEYSNYFGATSAAQSALVMAQVITAINRINEVYEIDVSVRLILVANTDLIFYYNAATDPYNNGNGSQMLGQNQTTCDNVIGNANYDIGHVFSTGGGGVAYLNSVCNNSIKAGGVTGQANPVGDPFYIDYVAHEMGHQFGGNHTQNNNCNRNGPTAMEPGSASTIMGYAGICAPNVQNNSDDYFHGISLQEIAARVTSTNCHQEVADNNSPPVVANVPNYTIPVSTPFVLTASATDPDNDPLTYCWEQWDNEVGTMPPVHTSTLGPMFRSLDPVASPSRYFYNLADLVSNVNPTWEELPSVSRDMEFRVTVRDYYDNLYGCTDEDNMIVTTTASSGPFTVTSQNSGATWLEGENQTITWNVANTTSAPVSCANVEILMSSDGGFTYPTVLAVSEANDGSATITVPAGVTTTARIMVKAVGNIFFDINNANIVINPGLPNFTLSLNPSSVSECNDGVVTTTVQVGQFMGFTDPVTLTLLNPPPGASFTFVPSVVIPGNTSVLTISNLAGLFGSYTPTVRGTSTTGNKDVNFPITLLQPPTSGPTLTSPANNATDIVITPLLDWQSTAGSLSYNYEVSTTSDFSNLVATGTSGVDQIQLTAPLPTNQLLYWRVRSVNPCGVGSWSAVFSFTTNSCFALNSTNVPVTIPESGTPTVFSTFNSQVEMIIDDINVINLQGAHSWVDDLKFSLISPDGTERLFWNQPCANHDNFNINFDDEAANSNWPCPPTNGLTYRPDNTLGVFDGESSLGVWQLKIQDVADQDGGSLTSWGLRVCGTLNCSLEVTQLSGTGPGTLPAAIACAGSGDTITLGQALANQTINVGPPVTINKSVVILAEGANINITGSGDRVFAVAGTGAIECNGFTITAGTSLTGGAIQSQGQVKLKNAVVEKNNGVTGATLIDNRPGAQLFVTGNCFINQ